MLVLVLALLSLGGGADPLAPAEDAFVKGEYQRAIALATRQLDEHPQRAWRVLGACYCFLKDAPRAQEACDHLDADGQRRLRYVCNRNKVTLK
jgi:hypothetical protein